MGCAWSVEDLWFSTLWLRKERNNNMPTLHNPDSPRPFYSALAVSANAGLVPPTARDWADRAISTPPSLAIPTWWRRMVPRTYAKWLTDWDMGPRSLERDLPRGESVEIESGGSPGPFTRSGSPSPGKRRSL